jgi:para-aminobenzoate synthetase / 4-amino-4-deoxychorismate lyase
MQIRCEINFPQLPTISDHERERRSFVQPCARHVATRIEQVKEVLNDVAAASAAGHWCVGFVAHEAAAAFDSAFVSPSTTQTDAATPLVWFAEFADMREAPLLSAAERDGFAVSPWQSDTTDAAFRDAVETIRADIRDGRFYQVNYTTRLRAQFTGDVLGFYRALQASQPGGYQVYIETDAFQLLSVSPELFFSLRDGLVTTQPMKGTAPRGDNATEDIELAEALTHSQKERAENLMIVDLLRNDLSRIALPGSVEVPHLFSLHALPSVWQMTSTVRARLRPGLSLVDVFAALFPCGSVTGAPKVEAMRAIAALETSPRGVYCGAIGVVAPGGVACFNVGIRSIWLQRDKTGSVAATCGVGSGITYDSTVAGEAAEVVYKARFVQRASKSFALFETIRLEEGRYSLLARHLARMENSARHFRFGFDANGAREALSQFASANAAGLWRVRLQSAADGELTVEAKLLDAVPARPTFMVAVAAVSSADEFLQHKTTRREVYDQHAPAAGVWDTLLWNERGELTEFIRANVVLDIDGERLTPPIASGLLNGTLRQQLLDEGRIREAVLTKRDLARASAVWWVNGLRGEVAVTQSGAASLEIESARLAGVSE